MLSPTGMLTTSFKAPTCEPTETLLAPPYTVASQLTSAGNIPLGKGSDTVPLLKSFGPKFFATMVYCVVVAGV